MFKKSFMFKGVHTTQNLWNYFQNDKNIKSPFTPRIIAIKITITITIFHANGR